MYDQGDWPEAVSASVSFTISFTIVICMIKDWPEVSASGSFTIVICMIKDYNKMCQCFLKSL